MHSAGVGRGRRAERRSRSPHCLHHGDSRLSRPDRQTVVREPKGGRRQQTSRGYPLRDGWCCHFVSRDCGYPSGGIADGCRGGGYCRTIRGKHIGRGVMERGSRNALGSSYLKLGARFSTKARTASVCSLVLAAATIFSAS